MSLKPKAYIFETARMTLKSAFEELFPKALFCGAHMKNGDTAGPTHLIKPLYGRRDCANSNIKNISGIWRSKAFKNCRAFQLDR